jgi:predicted alpha/beta superfamily hydrolase
MTMPARVRAARLVVSTAVLLSLCIHTLQAQHNPPMARAESEATISAADVVQQQTDAYNRRDIDAYAAVYAPDARVFNFPNEPVLSGREQIHTAFGASFVRSPGGRVTVLNQMEQGSYVFIQGRVSGVGPEPITGVAIYEVRDGRIQNTWLVQDGKAGQAAPTVRMPGTEVRSLHSAATGRDYDLYVSLPANYGSETGTRYPVLYVLDGQWDFKLLVSIFGGLVYDKFMPPSIIVGITYSGVSPDYEALRAMDYTPARDARVAGSGDADKFLAFLKNDVLPTVERSYRVEPSRRVLMGSSYAGLFTLHALFTEPQLFSAFISGSPAVTYADRFAFKQETEYAANHRDLPARLFIGVGGIESLAQPVQEIGRTIAGRKYAGLQLETRVIAGERHAGNKPEAFNRGLRFLFQQP